MKQAIIFDMDGTLFQTNIILEPALAATFDVLRENQLWFDETPISKYREIMGVPLPVVWETLCPDHSEEVREKSNELFQKKLIEMICLRKGELYSNVVETLQSLSNKYPLFVASNGEWEYLQAIIDTYELNQLFRKIYSIQSIASGNKSELVKSVLEENKITNAWVVGDRLSDIMAAKENGLVSIGVNFDFAQLEELNQADIVINEMKELMTHIR
ncbi:HAD hydrolase-like protein [Ureibacillus chungkukjangi]|uniref:HAD hydrolase-like protein n=1 Tax=Ureibacillus chungkukjangi TaxID=1202712 RepID=UPI00203ED205|nr:HAD hydrolase-like protein [Ureibacillus chungkukjangi]MCM3388877.1 HAD hydrolase-like protein [Ureibacillus chungkukjangi]